MASKIFSVCWVGLLFLVSLPGYLRGEGISAKTFVCLALAGSILFIQILWKS